MMVSCLSCPTKTLVKSKMTRQLQDRSVTKSLTPTVSDWPANSDPSSVWSQLHLEGSDEETGHYEAYLSALFPQLFTWTKS